MIPECERDGRYRATHAYLSGVCGHCGKREPALPPVPALTPCSTCAPAPRRADMRKLGDAADGLIREMLARGLSVRYIARSVGVQRVTVRRRREAR